MTQAKMGHVTATRTGNDMRFDCECGATERVVDYENGKTPKKFEWRMTFTSEHATCKTCGKEYTGNVGAQYR